MSWNMYKTKIKSGLKSSTMKQISVAIASLLMTSVSYAQTAAGGTGGLCAIGVWLKMVIGVVAIIAGLIYVINNFFAKSEIIGDIVIKVLLGCAIVAMLGFLVAQTGLGQNACGL
jgi:1,4-dihydroxy-2-naphthoate octaprenyltransferase